MAQVLARVFKVVLIIGLLWFGLWVLGQFGVLQMKSVILNLVSCYPGLSDVVSSYELGQKQSALLKRQQEKLKQDQKKLAEDQAQLLRDKDAFEKEKIQWASAHPVATPPRSGSKSGSQLVPGQLNPPKTSEQKVKEYLSLVGQMRPKQAAAVIQKLPEEAIFMIFDQLRRDQVVKIMENLPESFLSKLTLDRLNKYRDI
ncbi:MAG: hypothetical protein K6U80_06415 [Firmicutes bacterium]|nr:hypothetical protein [Bacillota bacterium]